MKIMLTKKKLLTWGSIATLFVICLFCIIQYLAHHPSTDDAYVQANTINVAAQVTGPIASIYVKDHQNVEKGQLLFTINPLPFQLAVNKAVASFDAQQAVYILAEQNAHRILKLVKLGQQPKAAGDQATSQLDSAKALLLEKQAQLAQAKLDLEHTRIIASSAGVVTQFSLRPGNNVIANATLFMIVEQQNFWVDANFKETQVARIKPGQPVKIELDMYPHHTFHGTVDAVSSASGSVFSLMPPENASGNWVKVTQRFPVKIIITDPNASFPLRAGSTATATVDTNNFKS